MHIKKRKSSSCSCKKEVMMCFLCILITMSILSLITINILQVPSDFKPEIGLSFLDNYPDAKIQRYFNIPINELKERDNEWINALHNNKIIDTVNIGHHGLAKKYLFILDGGYVAMAKPLERNLLFYPRSVFTTQIWDDLQPRSAVRMDRDYQGWGEVCGYALDKVLGWYRKPTIVSRYIDSKILYYHDYSNWGRILYSLPSHNVPVSMHAWVTGLYTKSPSGNTGRFLRHDTITGTIPNLDLMLEYSDVVLFDYLAGDHDRMGNHNWKVSSDGKMLVWDSGLAWNDGPKKIDTEILCGTHLWNGDDPLNTAHNIKRPNCGRICVFRNETITKLRNMGWDNNNPQSLGRRLERELQNEIPNLFEFGIYRIKRSGFWWWFNLAARFKENDFYEGTNERLKILLGHVNNCENNYGSKSVLL